MGLIGLGNMGSAFAERLLDAGFDLSVHNRTRARAEPLAERGATIAETAFDLAAGADVGLTSLSDDADDGIRDRFDGGGGGVAQGSGSCGGRARARDDRS